MGAIASTHPTITSIASASPRNSAVAGTLRSGAMRASAIANATAKLITGSIAPSTAALTGFAGTRPVSQLVNEGRGGTAPAAELAPRSDAAEVASIRSSEKNGGAARKVSNATLERIRTNSTTARESSPPTARASFSSAMVAINSDTTSGMIVIRIALTHRGPTGSSAERKPFAPFHDATEITTPVARPATRPIRVRTAALDTETNYDFWIPCAFRCRLCNGPIPEGRDVRDPDAAEESRVHADRPHHARTRHRREYGDLQRRERGAAAAAAVCKPRPAHPVNLGSHQAKRPGFSDRARRLLQCPEDVHATRRSRRGVHRQTPPPERRRCARTRSGRVCHDGSVSRARDAHRGRPRLQGGRRRVATSARARP